MDKDWEKWLETEEGKKWEEACEKVAHMGDTNEKMD
jgi:hypothetical protein